MRRVHTLSPLRREATSNRSPSVRTTRARIIHLQNDLKGLYDKIERGLHSHHESLREAAEAASAAGAGSTSTGTSSTDDAALQAPFAKVNDVVPGSPAESAGLKTGDTILKFGDVNWMNHEKLSKLVETVAQNIEVSWDIQGNCFIQQRRTTDGTGAAADNDSGSQRWRRRRAARPATDTEAQLGRQRSVGLSFAAVVDSGRDSDDLSDSDSMCARDSGVGRRRLRGMGGMEQCTIKRKCVHE